MLKSMGMKIITILLSKYSLSGPMGGGILYCFWFQSHLHWYDAATQYLKNQLSDFNHICLDNTLGHDVEFVRFW